jgi:hypothetical protein
MRQPPELRALVVDYTPQIVGLVRAVLHTMIGVDHIDSTGRGDIAADLLRANVYDLVVIEAVVPYGDERLLAHIARCHPSAGARMIVMTAAPIVPAVLATSRPRSRMSCWTSRSMSARLQQPFARSCRRRHGACSRRARREACAHRSRRPSRMGVVPQTAAVKSSSSRQTLRRQPAARWDERNDGRRSASGL